MSILKICLALSKTSLDSEQWRSLRDALVVVHGGSFVPFAVGSLRYSGYEKLGQDPCTSRSSREEIGRLALIERPYIHIYTTCPGFRATTAEVREIPIRNIALIRLLILTSQTWCRAGRQGDKFVPRENNWQQLGAT